MHLLNYLQYIKPNDIVIFKINLKKFKITGRMWRFYIEATVKLERKLNKLR